MTNPNEHELEQSSEDKIPGGLADKAKPEDFNHRALAMGLKAELEHTDDLDIALEIAMDHLSEDPGYYDKLEIIHPSENEEKPEEFEGGDGVKEPHEEAEDFEKTFTLSGSGAFAIVDASVVKSLKVPGAENIILVPVKTSSEQEVQFTVKGIYDDATLRKLIIVPSSPEEEPVQESMGSPKDTKASRTKRKHTTVQGIKRNENQRDSAKNERGGGQKPRFGVRDPEKGIQAKVRRTARRVASPASPVVNSCLDYLQSVKDGKADLSLLNDWEESRKLLSDLMGVCVGRIKKDRSDQLDFDLIYEAWQLVDKAIVEHYPDEVRQIEESIERGLDLV